MRFVLVGLVALALLPRHVFCQEDRLTFRSDSHDTSRYICDLQHATFTTPKNWQPNRSGKNTYAVLTRADETYPNVTQMITIDVGKPVVPTAKLVADAFAKKWNGSVLKEALKVDGEEGYRVKMSPSMKDVRPIDCVVVFKDKRVFMLIGGAKSNGGIEKAIDDVVASWKWKRKPD